MANLEAMSWRSVRRTLSRTVALTLLGAGSVGGGVGGWGAIAVAADWAPVRVEVREPAFHPYGTFRRVDYRPGEAGTRPWRLCASLPGLTFAYFAAVAHGLRAEAARQNVALQIVDAGDFDAARQREQLEECLADRADAILVAAASDHLLAPVVAEARAQGVPVIDMVTGMDVEGVSARVVADARAIGFAVGEYLAERYPLGSDIVGAAWFPGPDGAVFSAAYDEGFRQAVTAGAVDIVGGGFAELDRAALSRAVGEALGEGDAIEVIAGVGPAIAIAAQNADARDDARFLIATGISPDIVDGIEGGRVEAAINDKPVVVGRIAVDLAVRLLDGEPFVADMRPTLELVDQSNIDVFDRSTALAPDR